jgi:hypothetical protein
VLRLACRAAALAGSYEAASQDLLRNSLARSPES